MAIIKIEYDNELRRYWATSGPYIELGALADLLVEVLGYKGLEKYFIDFIFDPTQTVSGGNETHIFRQTNYFEIHSMGDDQLIISKHDFYYIMAQLREALDKGSKEIIIARDENKKYSVTYC